MIIKNISIKNLGFADQLSLDFDNTVNTIKTRESSEIAFAIKVILNNKSVPCPSLLRVGADTEIMADVIADGKLYRISATYDQTAKKLSVLAKDEKGEDVTKEYLYISEHCEAQDNAEIFNGDERDHHLSLCRYINAEYLYAQSELKKKTRGYSSLKSFRSQLLRFFKNFTPEPLRLGKQYEIILERNGIYNVQHSNNKAEKVYLSDCEQMLFNYLCFLRTAEFWREFEELRNLHATKKPILVKNFLNRLDESVDASNLIKRTSDLGRQVIILN